MSLASAETFSAIVDDVEWLKVNYWAALARALSAMMNLNMAVYCGLESTLQEGDIGFD